MAVQVSKDAIDERVVKEWQRLIIEVAKEKGDEFGSVEPFHLRGVTYSDVMREVKAKSYEGLTYYRLMIAYTPGYYF